MEKHQISERQELLISESSMDRAIQILDQIDQPNIDEKFIGLESDQKLLLIQAAFVKRLTAVGVDQVIELAESRVDQVTEIAQSLDNFNKTTLDFFDSKPELAAKLSHTLHKQLHVDFQDEANLEIDRLPIIVVSQTQAEAMFPLEGYKPYITDPASGMTVINQDAVAFQDNFYEGIGENILIKAISSSITRREYSDPRQREKLYQMTLGSVSSYQRLSHLNQDQQKRTAAVVGHTLEESRLRSIHSRAASIASDFDLPYFATDAFLPWFSKVTPDKPVDYFEQGSYIVERLSESFDWPGLDDEVIVRMIGGFEWDLRSNEAASPEYFWTSAISLLRLPHPAMRETALVGQLEAVPTSPDNFADTATTLLLCALQRFDKNEYHPEFVWIPEKDVEYRREVIKSAKHYYLYSRIDQLLSQVQQMKLSPDEVDDYSLIGVLCELALSSNYINGHDANPVGPQGLVIPDQMAKDVGEQLVGRSLYFDGKQKKLYMDGGGVNAFDYNQIKIRLLPLIDSQTKPAERFQQKNNDLLRALELGLGKQPFVMDETIVKAIHQEIGNTDKITAMGHYRTANLETPSDTSDYTEIDAHMAEWVDRYNQTLEAIINQDTLTVSDIYLQAAAIYREFTNVHPFLNGNGRTGRVLTTLFLNQIREKRPELNLKMLDLDATNPEQWIELRRTSRFLSEVSIEDVTDDQKAEFDQSFTQWLAQEVTFEDMETLKSHLRGEATNTQRSPLT